MGFVLSQKMNKSAPINMTPSEIDILITRDDMLKLGYVLDEQALDKIEKSETFEISHTVEECST